MQTKQLPLATIYIFITFFLILTQHAYPMRLLYPISFAIIRHSTLNNYNLTNYMNNIGYPKIDSYGHNIGYNMIALDGFKTSTSKVNLQSDVTPLATWTDLYSRIMGNKRNLYGRNTSQLQQYIVNRFHQRASKLLLNAFSFQRPISESNSNPISVAQQLSIMILTNNLDGVSIQFDDFNSVRQKRASEWLNDLLKTLRKRLGKGGIIVLIIPSTFVNEIQLFRSPLINSYVNVFVFKYFNLLNEDYSNFQSIFNKSSRYNLTSIWEIQLNSLIKVDTCKIVIAKPSSFSGTWTGNAFLTSNSLASIFDQARMRYSWFGGYANMDFGSDLSGEFQLTALSTLRAYCYKYQRCSCK